MSTHGPSAEVLVTEWTWKTPAMKAMTIAVCRLALAKGHCGHFSALDLDRHGEEAHGGAGIAGSVFRQLAEAHILAPVGAWVDNEFVQRRVRNACGNPIGLWRLDNGALARALLVAHAPKNVSTEAQLQLL